MIAASRASAPSLGLVFGLGLSIRLALLLGVGEPILYSHPYHYFRGGLQIIEHPSPLDHVLHSDEWRTWGELWTIAPLYYWVVALVLKLTDSLLALQLLQCVLDALVGVCVAVLGRALDGRRGAWAGIAYAVWSLAAWLPSQTFTENIHTVLMFGAFALLAAEEPSVRRAGLAGLLLGVSALARAVSSAFVPICALLLFWPRRRLAPALALCACAAVPVLPWAARNWLITHDPSPIESVSTANLWMDNTWSPEKLDRQQFLLRKEKDLGERRSRATRFALESIRSDPGAFLDKIGLNLARLARPDGLHFLLGRAQPRPAWRSALAIVADDLLVLGTLPLALAGIVGLPASATRRLLLAWLGYYLFFLIVVFHVESRYRLGHVPVLFAFAAAGPGVLGPGERRARARAGLLGGLAFVAWGLSGYLLPAVRAARAAWAFRSVAPALARGDQPGAEDAVYRALNLAPWGWPQPWQWYGRLLAHADRPADALRAYERADDRHEHGLLPALVRPRLLREAGRLDELPAAVAEAHRLSHATDPWLALEAAWDELPAPRTSAVLLAQDDYGAVRGFLHPRHGFRWSRARAWIRLRPGDPAARFDVMVEMGFPEPSPLAGREVELRSAGGSVRCVVAREFGTCRLPGVRPSPDGVVLVELRSPTWNRASEPAEQGVAVRGLSAVPAG